MRRGRNIVPLPNLSWGVTNDELPSQQEADLGTQSAGTDESDTSSIIRMAGLSTQNRAILCLSRSETIADELGTI